MKTSPLHVVIYADVDDVTKSILKSAIDPWVFFNSHGISIKKVDGSAVSISGCKFDGSAYDVFWGGFASDYIRTYGRKVIESTRKKAIDRGQSTRDALKHCEDCLHNSIRQVYTRMAEIDQHLRGEGYPSSISRKNTDEYIRNDFDYLKEIIGSELACSPKAQSKRWHSFFELKPNFFGLGLNLNSLCEWWENRKTNRPIEPTR